MATRVLGIGALRRKLRALPGEAKLSIASEMEKAAQEVVDLAKSLVPVDDGDLRDSIGWTWGDPPRGSMTLGKLFSKKRKPRKKANDNDMRLTIYAGDDKAFYARFVEFGTKAAPARGPRRNRNFRRLFVLTRSYAAHHATRAQPFFFPAWRALRKRIKGKVSRAITKAAKKVAAS